MRQSDVVGKTIGSYRIDARLGAGGMGEVYRAHDAKLDRPVAIKFLGAALGHTADAIERFAAEARTISSLNHPHILVIHDVGEIDGAPFIVTELVEGHTLRERLEQGNITVREAIDIGRQVASALAAAHARYVVHRDIKPENIMVRPDGYVKVLDFGLAKLMAAAVEDDDDRATRQAEGELIVGTPEYMSPEQASGKPLDFRTDQFSLGVVLYELVTGQSPFRRPSRVQTAAAVITDDPPSVSRLRPDISPPLRWAIERCLAKRREDRYTTTDELQRELATVHERISDVNRQAVVLPPPNLPVGSTPLVGRDSDAATLGTLLGRDDVRWVTVTGAGGVGKTRLMLHVARELAPRFAGAVYFVPLGSVTDASLVPSAFAQALDVRASGGERPMAAVQRVLRASDQPLLLVIDNFEHVAGTAVDVAELLECSEHIKLLASSRARLNLSAEHEYQLAPLSLPARRHSTRLETLAATPSIALFVDRARAARANFTLTAENAAAVADICVALDGLPLAIELAAARVKVLTPQALFARMADKRLSLTGGARDLPSRQQTLRATMEWGYELLTAAEQRLFRRLAAFVGGWTLEAAEAVCNAREDLGLDVLDGISSLVDKSLVQPMDDGRSEPRFTMLSTIREYAVERLDGSDDAAATRKAHAAYCLVLAEEGTATDSAAQVRWLDLCDAEHPNLRAALDYLTTTRQAEWAMRLASALVPYWQSRAHLAEGRDSLSKTLTLCGEHELPALRARIMFLLGTVLNAMGDSAAAVALYDERALPLYRQLNDDHGVAATLNATAICRAAIGQDPRAREALSEALSIWRRIGQSTAAVRTLVNLASLDMDEGKLAEAIELYRQARTSSEAARDDAGAAWAINFEAQAQHAAGDQATAEQLHGEALKRFRALGDGWGEADSLLGLGQVAAEAGDPDRSRQLLAESHRVSQRMSDVRGTVRVVESFARIAARDGQATRALVLAGAAAGLRRSLNAPLRRLQREALDRALEEARRQLDPRTASAAWMEGWGLSVDEAADRALAADR